MLLDEPLERALHDRRRHLVGRELGVERDVAEAAGDDPAVRPLMPVVEAVPAVVRDLEQHLLDRLGRDHLAPRRDDETLELAEEAARVSVGRDDDGRRARVVDRADARVLVDLDARLRGAPREAANEPSRLEHAVRRVEERCRVAPGERRRRDPRATRRRSRLRREPRTPRAARLAPRRRPRDAGFRSVGGRRPRAHRELAQLVLGPAPERGRRVRADRIGEHGIRRRRRREARSRRSARSRRPRSRAPRTDRTFRPASASASAHEQPVIPPPTTATSASPSSSTWRAAARSARRASTRSSTCGRRS